MTGTSDVSAAAAAAAAAAAVSAAGGFGQEMMNLDDDMVGSLGKDAKGQRSTRMDCSSSLMETDSSTEKVINTESNVGVKV